MTNSLRTHPSLALFAALCLCAFACKQTLSSGARSYRMPDATPSPVGTILATTVASPTGTAIVAHQPEPSTSEVVYAAVEPEHGHAWKPEWNTFIAEAIDSVGQDLLTGPNVPTSDMLTLCPGVKDAAAGQKKAFWALFFASFARYESGYDPGNRFQEDASLNHVYSEGLLQLSYGDEANHAGCPLSKSKGNVTDPKANLTCGVAIMRNQLRQKRTLFTTSHYYWSVLTNKKTNIAADFRKAAPQLGFCMK